MVADVDVRRNPDGFAVEVAPLKCFALDLKPVVAGIVGEIDVREVHGPVDPGGVGGFHAAGDEAALIVLPGEVFAPEGFVDGGRVYDFGEAVADRIVGVIDGIREEGAVDFAQTADGRVGLKIHRFK